MAAVSQDGVKVIPHKDNLIVRIAVSKITDTLMDYRDNSGYFYEYDCKDINMLKPICNDKRCQTIAYLGDSETIIPLLRSGVKGIDRIVPIGKTMDFDFVWDGWSLQYQLTRSIVSEYYKF